MQRFWWRRSQALPWSKPLSWQPAANAFYLAEDSNNAAATPAATVNMDHNTFIPSEITVAPGTTVTWVNAETMPPHRGRPQQRVPVKDPCERRLLLFHLHHRGGLQLPVLDPSEHEGQSHRQTGSQLRFAHNDRQPGPDRAPSSKSAILARKFGGRENCILFGNKA